ncbi:hypothetical protein CF326_g5899 [Tilletia indica]|uniref:Uncharacterized protein n=1 Tax=Tilletia indica TaxID=43049 RepID=A0A177T6K5_9BASI|nr:hypothetical protein CF326_g5899 [Tilletia indica]KAE8241679.1 hypothetical protein A4X13_0g7310 [Tilletia indica]
MATSQHTVYVVRDGVAVPAHHPSPFSTFVPQSVECTDPSMALYEACRVCNIRRDSGRSIESAECSWRGHRAINPKHNREEQHLREEKDGQLLIGEPLSPLPEITASRNIDLLSPSKVLSSEYHLAKALFEDLSEQCALVAGGGCGIITRSKSYVSMLACESCSRYFLAAWQICTLCGLEICPSCFQQLMGRAADEQRRDREEGSSSHQRTGNDFLACLHRGGGVYSTHRRQDFVIVAQISEDDLLFLAGAAGHFQHGPENRPSELPFQHGIERFPRGTYVKCVVKEKVDEEGFILQIRTPDTNVHGLCYYSEILDSGELKGMEEYKVGDHVNAVVLNSVINLQKKSISFGMKPLYFSGSELSESDEEGEELTNRASKFQAGTPASHGGPDLKIRPHQVMTILDDSRFETAISDCIARVDEPVVVPRRVGSKTWDRKSLQTAFSKGTRMKASLSRKEGEDPSDTEISPKLLFEALCSTEAGISCRDFPKDADLSEVAPDLDASFRAAVGTPSLTQKTSSTEVSLISGNIKFRDAKAKVYAASASEEKNATTLAHVDECMAVNYCLWANEDEEEEDDNDDGTAAIWLIFRHADFEAVVDFYEKTYGVDHSDKHPIFSQSRYLSNDFLRQLQLQRGIEPWMVPQRPGETVIVPPGCIHQVRNLKSCFKIAADVFPASRAGTAVKISNQRALESCRRGPYSVEQLGRDGLALYPTMLDAFRHLVSRHPASFADQARSRGVEVLLRHSLVEQSRLRARVHQLETQLTPRPLAQEQPSLSRDEVASIFQERLNQTIIQFWNSANPGS